MAASSELAILLLSSFLHVVDVYFRNSFLSLHSAVLPTSVYQKNHQQRANSSTFLIIGSAYDPAAKQAISSTPGLKLCTSGGAGYKSLCVAEGLVDAYLYTEDEIYKWDTCAPQCLLMGLGGSVVSAQKLRETAGGLEILQISYL